MTQAQLDAISVTYNVTGITQALHNGMQEVQDLVIAFNQAALSASVVVNT